MKSISKKLCLLFFLLISSFVNGQTEETTVEGGELENVTISCKNTRAGIVTINFGFISLTYERFTLICDNGYTSNWISFW